MTVTRSDLPPQANLLLHVMYEHQHVGGKGAMTSGEIILHASDELFEHKGDIEAAVASIRKRCGLNP